MDRHGIGASTHAPFSRWTAFAISCLLTASFPSVARAGEDDSFQTILRALGEDYANPQVNCALLFKSKTAAVSPDEVSHLNIREFSTRTTLFGCEDKFGIPPGTFEAGVRTGKTREVYEKYPKIGSSLWSASLIPFEAYRRYVFDHDLPRSIQNPRFSGLKTMDEIESKLRGPLSTPSSEYRESVLADFIARQKAKKTSITPDRWTLLALCGAYGKIWEADACARALGKILDAMSPTGDSIFDQVLLDEFFEFYKSDAYVEPLRRLALRVIAAVKSNEVPATGLFDDLVGVFGEAGMSSEAAYSAAWRFMGISASAGANISFRFDYMPHQETARQFYPLLFSVITFGTSVLDARALEKGRHLYSMPKNVASSVENAKPYHFWMSAFLAWKSAREVGSASAAANAAWLAQLGYQIKSKTIGRDPTRAFQVLPFGPENNKLRLDLAYAANGAIFGANSAEKIVVSNFDVDETLRRLLVAGDALPVLTPKETSELFKGTGIEAWQRWRRIFGPDAAIRFAQERLEN